MRLRELTLDFFGHFSGKRFDFGDAGEGPDFHVVYGSNEAGKTTLMEAYIRLLYGFPNREPYDFLHQRKNLRISGVFEANGERLSLTRLPKRAPNLLDEHGNPLPEQAIAAHLAGLSEEDYRKLLCLDDRTIEVGGEEIANARGEIGRLLFSAAAGIANLGEVLGTLRDQADTLYRKRASKTRMAELKRQLSETDRQIREYDISLHKWRDLKAAAAAAREEERVAREKRNRLRRELETTRAMRRTLPWLGEYSQLLREVQEHAHFPQYLDIDPDELLELEKEQDRLLADVKRLEKARAAAKEELRTITIDPGSLALVDELEKLDEMRSRMQTAGLDLPRRRRELAEVLDDMRRSVRELGAREDIAPEGFVLTQADLSRLQAAREALLSARRDHENAAREHEKAERQSRAAREALNLLTAETGTDTPPAATPAREEEQASIGEILHRHAAEALAPAVARAKEALNNAQREAATALARLSHGETHFTALPFCPLAPDRARALADEHAQLTEQLAATEKELEGLQQTIRAKSARLDALAPRGTGISDEEALAARRERDTLWQEHLQALTKDSAEAFERAMLKADEIADARLARASDLAEIRQLQGDRAEAEARARTVEARIARLKARLAEIETEVAQAAAAIGLHGITPGGLPAWLERYQSAAEALQRLQRVEAEHADTLQRARKLTRLLAARLGLQDPSFESALAAARQAAEKERETRERLADARRLLQERERTWKEQAERLRTAQDTLREAQQQWETLVSELFGEAVEAAAVLNGIDQLHSLRELDLKRRHLERQIRGMEEDQQAFSSRIAALAAHHGIKVDDPLVAHARLREITDKAQEDERRRKRLKADIAKAEEQIRTAEERLAEIRETTHRLAREFPGGMREESLQSLRQMVMKARAIIDKRKRMEELERQIISELGVSNIEEARKLLGGIAAAELEARIGGYEQDLDQAEELLDNATEARVNAERDLANVGGEGGVAALMQRRSTLLAEIEETARDYLQLDLGLSLAEEAIRRYRDIHRSDMMQATERAFRELTNGAYKALRLQTEGEREVLVAVDGKGMAKRVNDLSKGTRFQLYFALRVAAYEQMVRQGIRLPFFCDDVFETFDEERTRAACRLLERLGRCGQAIYLTHHRHVVEIAREACKEKPLIHSL